MPVSLAQTVTTTTAMISGLTNGTTYYIWVKGKNANGESNVSAVASGKPLGTPGTPTVTSGFRALLVTWTSVAGADEYEVYYGTGTPITLAETTAGTTATITGLTNGTTYNVRLRAKNANGISDYGSSASGVPVLSSGLYRGGEKIGNQNLDASLTYISTNAVNGDDFSIILGSDESIAPKSLSYSGRRVGITLLGFGGERKINLASNGNMFTVSSNVTLTLDENITLVGRSENNASLVRVGNGSILIMNEGAKVSGNNSGSSDGGGISISGGTFTMNGGEISGNTATNAGGGVHVTNGTFTMNGGMISKNTARGGGIFVGSGTVTMNDGTIRGNNSDSQGGGVEVSGGTFTMHGGIINGNTASNVGGGVFSSGTFKKLPPSGGGQNSGIIYGSEATGVDVDGIPLKNNGYGTAVFTNSRYRNTTADQTDQIDTVTGRGLSANGSPPYGE
jgi:hypothetical protein